MESPFGETILILWLFFYSPFAVFFLIIPHVDIENREFVLVPMNEIAPYKRHPIFKKTMQEMLTELKNK